MLFRTYPNGEDVDRPVKILVTGSRDWVDESVIVNAFLLWRATEKDTVIHGDARGADKLAGMVASQLGMAVIPVPANWGLLGKAAGMIRNQMMLEMEPDFIFAFHDDLPTSRGTRDMVRRARFAGHRKVYHFLGDGSCSWLAPFKQKGNDDESE